MKSPPYFWLALHRAKVRWRFRKILWPSQNIWTLLSYPGEFSSKIKFCLIIYFIKNLMVYCCILQVEGSFVTQNFTQTVIAITFFVRTRRDENVQEFWTFWQVHSNPIQSLHRTSLESSSVSIWELISSCRQVSSIWKLKVSYFQIDVLLASIITKNQRIFFKDFCPSL